MPLSIDLLLAFALFAFVTSVTPGPNNTMLLASGVNFGFRRTVPHILGISSGFLVLVLAVGLGLGAVFEAYPVLYKVLRYVGAAYLLYLAWNIARSGPVSQEVDGQGRPLGFWGAAAFQWVNPKAWVMALGAISTYTPLQGYFFNVVVIASLFALINAPSVGVWAGFGSVLRNVLRDPRWLRLFNYGMALLLVISLFPLLQA
ncbi:Transporter, LysE family [Pseudomonas chlororaphis subsp. aurantiaca]|jgi:threonine/homoserine/homoserine lactone efflux protein|uniref:LysE family translocator n=1 Tax=Pseudomonas chlororaphis subsp. aurantiaca TaxID=86192 RepID=A0AAJ0ZIA5_9PSED|nr:LysE family translocator [Pseudomonas chlororaphis]AIS14186.1 lysine transporter LysE [Pseudomonas chlororaphis subsp. aurantiaca]AZC29711.1 Transporter, LysE family [Pseudomonas chlororaphis subsp. piscium]AZD21022.1 Transporter, LysE family [Pseudomonas chlororaphis subsp. aurantiaca]AZD34477.1 Transporter, LysE family [Pseudomonas chlororaphis subsp. aurantiaca]AZD40812.1 Transporter, LysE family [Pseudomonas chlororaphis subsp. aurantiaca]